MPEPTTFDEWHKQFEHPGMSYSDEIERDDRRAAWDAAWAAATERAARVVEGWDCVCAMTCQCHRLAAAIRGATPAGGPA